MVLISFKYRLTKAPKVPHTGYYDFIQESKVKQIIIVP